MESMTGYGALEKGNLRIEARSLNHRFLEINFRMSPVFYPSEFRMRELVKSRFSRGKIDISITFLEPPSNFKLNRQLLLNIIEGLKGLEPGGLPFVVNLKDLMVEIPYNYDEVELLHLLDDALMALKTMRLKEGENLKRELYERIGKIGLINDKIKLLQAQAREEGLSKWKEKIQELLRELEVERENREKDFWVTIGSILEKMDISEEIVRIESHTGQFKTLLEQPGPVGKRLDFLIQEILREFNTIGAKSMNLGIRTLVVEAKTELEGLREQIQNVE